MASQVDVIASVLFVEPEMSAQLDLLELSHEAQVQVDLACVSTCGGARHALGRRDFDFLLLSTNLCFYEDEHRELSALARVARLRGVAVLSLGPQGACLGLPVHETLSLVNVRRGELCEALERARARADVDALLAHRGVKVTPLRAAWQTDLSRPDRCQPG